MVLINQYGLPDLTSERDNGMKICSWNLGVKTESSGAYGGGGFFSSSSGNTEKITAYIDSAGKITELRSNGCYLGNEEEITQAEYQNRLVSLIGYLGAISIFLSLIIV